VKFPRRRFLHLAASAVALSAVSNFARAQTYPTRPMRLIVGFPPAGPNDILARLIARWLSDRLNQPFVIENRAGVGGNIGTEAVVKATADGYTLLFIDASAAFNATLYETLSFNFIRDIAPVAGIIRTPLVMVVNPFVPAKTIPEFIAYVKANPARASFASGGNGTANHIAAELFKMMSGVDMQHVPYRGGAPALTDVIAGQVPMMFIPTAASIEQIRAGKLRALAVTSTTRSELLLDVPTVGEFLPGYEASTWNGVGAPKNTPVEIIDRLNKEIGVAFSDPNMKAQLADLGAAPTLMSAAEFRAFIADETEKWGKVIRAANIRPE
jgi:tripartite-type tricarboxylate transporter receptor subunit TctC